MVREDAAPAAAVAALAAADELDREAGTPVLDVPAAEVELAVLLVAPGSGAVVVNALVVELDAL